MRQGIPIPHLLRRVRLQLRHLTTPKRRADLGPSLRGNLDEPNDSWLPRRPVTFWGWALDGIDLPKSVELVINGDARIVAAIGRPRPDVPINLSEAEVPSNCGWSSTVDLSEWPEGDFAVQVVAEGRAGHRDTLVHRAFLLRGPAGDGRVDEPPPGGTVDRLLIVRGWAVIGSQGPARVDVEIDGALRGRARLRLPRPDVEATDPLRDGALAGFEYRGTLPSSHGDVIDVDVTVIARDGAEMRLPTRSVRAQKSALAAADLRRAEILRKRTRDDAQRLVIVPARPGRLIPGREVLIFTHSLRLGGGELYLQELLRRLVPSMRRCILVAPSDGPLREELEGLGVEVVISEHGLPRDLESYEGMVRELTMFIQGTGCEIVILNTLGQWVAADAAATLGVPSVWAIHESFELADWLDLNYGPPGCHPYIMERIEITLGAATRLVFEANATSAMFAAYSGAERRVVIPYGVDVEAIDSYAAGIDREQTRRDRGIRADATLVLAMGVLEERKSQGCLVEAFAEVSSVHRDAVLVLVGDHPSAYSDALRRAMSAFGLGDRVHLIPITPDIYPWYAIADLLVSASDVESVPRSMLEAMAFGVPVLSTDVFGVPELIEDGANGWLCDPRDMVALIAGFHRVLSLTDTERSKAGDEARSTVRSRHRSSTYGQSYRELLETVAPTVQAIHQ